MKDINRSLPIFCFIFPCHNEEEIIPFTFNTAKDILIEMIASKRISNKSFTLFVDDGSKDGTWETIVKLAENDDVCRGLKLAKNVGHQNALYAGMVESVLLEVDCMISLDVDLQDDISISVDMIEDFKRGIDIVYGVRCDRSSDSFFKRITAGLYYKAMTFLGVEIIPHHADYRLCGRNILETIQQYGETELFLRAIFPTLGFKSSVVSYARKPRTRGETKYTLRKMLSFAWRGITSFSSAPLRVTSVFSLFFIVLAVIQAVAIIHGKLSGEMIQNWSLLMMVFLIFSSIQLFSLSLVGEYIAKIFIAVKKRPRFIVEKRI